MLTTLKWNLRGAFPGKVIVRRRCKPEHNDQDLANAPIKAKERLRQLLSGYQDPEEEVLQEFFGNLSNESKIQFTVASLGISVLAASLLTFFCGVAPYGGMLYEHPSMTHWGYAVVTSSPLVLSEWVMRREFMPDFIKEYISNERRNWKNISQSLSLSEKLLSTALLSIASNFFIYCGLVECMSSLIQRFGYQSTDPSGTKAFVISLVTAGLMVGNSMASAVSLDQERVDMVLDASKNADRYYRVTQQSSNPTKARHYAKTFQNVSLNYLMANDLACQFAIILAILKVSYGGVVWKLTGNVSTTLGLFLIHSLSIIVFEKDNK